MAIKRILLTGDDGYNSIGIRVLAKVLSPKYDIAVAATLEQQSGVGGKLSFEKKEVRWGNEIVDGHKAVWVDGTPVDTVEFAQGYFKRKFDLIISGINLGENLGRANISSGTFCAGVRGIGVGLADKAIIMSLQVKLSDHAFRNHSQEDSIKTYLDYPGKMVTKVIDFCIANEFFGSKIINVNFPAKPTTKHEITKFALDITKIWPFPMIIDHKRKVFTWPRDRFREDYKETDRTLDTGALEAGLISITPVVGF